MNLYISKSTNHIPIRYLDYQEDSNLIINLLFLQLNLSKLDNYTIYPEWKLLSDHTLLTVNITIVDEYIQTKSSRIAKLIEAIKGLNMAYITSKEVLK